MADRSRRLDFNVPGAFYVDDQCINCGVCMEIAASVFAANDDQGYAYVAHQPEAEADEESAREALESCPVEAIGDDGE